MRNKIIAKTLLSIWPGLQDYEEMLAARAMTHALGSFNHTPRGTERLMEQIITLNVKQHTIRNLRNSLDKVINRLDPSVQQVVRNYYQDYEAADNVKNRAAKLGMSERSYFRKLDSAITDLAQKLPRLGINFFTWKYLLDHHPWIREAFTRALQPNHRRNPLRQTE